MIEDSYLIVGIDEAGRGPVIGNMFIVCLGVSEGKLSKLIELRVKDSKKLTPEKRSELAPKITQLAEVLIVESVSPQRIDEQNINGIFAKFIIESLETILRSRVKIKQVYIDAVSGRKFRDIIMNYAESQDNIMSVHIEPRADVKYPIVAAASIVAKYLRDAHVRRLHMKYGDFGSGYPSDPRTIRWLIKYRNKNNLPPIVRRSWSTLRKLGISQGSKGLEKWFKF
ncbi:MAG: ribonuclease HII [Desulfurococcales archaeon]|nr:ribonuclease HII [Desulfurococcales archaeon]